MTSEAMMILPYEWILENVDEQTTTLASKMISFRGEKVFCVGVKNYAAVDPILFFMAIDLGKIGMKVEDVKCGFQGSSPITMTEMTKKDIGDEGSLQLFTIDLTEKVFGNWMAVFRICIVGTDPGYSYQLSDRLAKDQLWAALIIQKHLADVEFVVKDKIFPAHKAILAARSPVFADKFEKKQAVKGGPHQIRIDGVEPSTMENFLHFIYTGELYGKLADGDLLKLADYYQIKALSGLCKVALKKMDALQITNTMKNLNSNADEEISSSKITPEKETEIFFDRTTPTFRCNSKLDENGKSTCVMKYQNEDLFIAYFTGERELHTDSNRPFVIEPVINLSCVNHRNFGLKVEDIYCDIWDSDYENEWLKMESKYFQKNAELLHVAAVSPSHFYVDPFLTVDFDIKMTSTIGNYYYEMMDDGWLKDLWLAATNQKLTDVEIFVGTVKMMEAHRVILCARSPVLNSSLNKIINTNKSIVTFGVEFDVDTVKHFLNFLYTGFLMTGASGKQMSQLAIMYEVETLKNVCQVFNANPPDAEHVAGYLLHL
ncbi:uncharacterized protein LOC124205502 [Daphnia pulex]|uniref:uncharacterized protein LOC124205502 n=1 Tax=Daphnia pulex TaxID=6669 RepID=UPI001EDCDC18|nr:uncharacterized protein LOC124205502 [Daphnia pulex]